MDESAQAQSDAEQWLMSEVGPHEREAAKALGFRPAAQPIEELKPVVALLEVCPQLCGCMTEGKGDKLYTWIGDDYVSVIYDRKTRLIGVCNVTDGANEVVPVFESAEEVIAWIMCMLSMKAKDDPRLANPREVNGFHPDLSPVARFMASLPRSHCEPIRGFACEDPCYLPTLCGLPARGRPVTVVWSPGPRYIVTVGAQRTCCKVLTSSDAVVRYLTREYEIDTGKRCGGCLESKPDMFVCGGCCKVSYCSPACQKVDRRVHRELCEALREGKPQVREESFGDRLDHDDGGDYDGNDGSDESERRRRQCHRCGRPRGTPCGGCYLVRYCSVLCQREDWKDHSPICRNACRK